MRNSSKLEAKWRLYKYKQFIPYIIVLVLSLILIIYYFLKDNNSDLQTMDYELISSNSTEDIILAREPLAIHGDFNLLEPEIISYFIAAKQICVVKPILNFKITNDDKNESIELDTALPKNENIEIKDVLSQPSSQEVCLDLPTENKNGREKVPKKIKFDTINSTDAIGDIMRRFNQSKDPNDSLFLANNFYESGDYSKALYWAIETNKITEDIEDGWLLMAKSKAKLGDKNEAVRILRAYSSKKISLEASELARSIEANEWN